MKLESVPKGFQDIYEGTGNEDFENPQVVVVSGDSTQAVEKTGPKTLQLTVRGDGSIAPNAFNVQVDGHIGDGDVPVVTEFDYDVTSPDATQVTFAKVRREPIPS